MRTNDIFAIVSQCYTCSQFMHVHTHICWKSNVIRKSKFLKKINDFRFYAFRIQRIRVRDRFYRPTDNSDAYHFFLFTVLALWFFRVVVFVLWFELTLTVDTSIDVTTRCFYSNTAKTCSDEHTNSNVSVT